MSSLKLLILEKFLLTQSERKASTGKKKTFGEHGKGHACVSIGNCVHNVKTLFLFGRQRILCAHCVMYIVHCFNVIVQLHIIFIIYRSLFIIYVILSKS